MEDITDLRYKESLIKVNPTGSIQHNPSLTTSEVVVGTVTTKTITKTIGSTSYVKTVASDSSDNSVIVSTWSAV